MLHRNLNRFSAFAAMIALAGLALGQKSKPEQKGIAVLPFDVVGAGSLGKYQHEGEVNISEFGAAFGEEVEAALLKRGGELVEREKLKHIIEEQKRSHSGPIEASAAVKIGKLTGARYALLGTLSTMTYSERGWGPFGERKATIGGTAKLVDCETGRIVRAYSGEGERKEQKVKLGTSSESSAGPWGNIPLMGSAVRDFAEKIATNMLGASDAGPNGTVSAVLSPTEVIVDTPNGGARLGMAVRFVHLGKAFKNSEGKTVYQEKSEAGKGKVVDVQDRGCRVQLDDGVKVKSGDLVFFET